MDHLILNLKANPLSTTDAIAAKALHLAETWRITIVVEFENGDFVNVEESDGLSNLIALMRVTREGNADAQELAN